jgi:hypothetical protein
MLVDGFLRSRPVVPNELAVERIAETDFEAAADLTSCAPGMLSARRHHRTPTRKIRLRSVSPEPRIG